MNTMNMYRGYRPHRARNVLAAGSIGLAGLIGVDYLGNFDVMGRIEHSIGKHLPKFTNTAPPKGEAGVDQASVAVSSLELHCDANLTAGVAVRAHRDGGYHSAKNNKTWFGQEEVCGNGNKLEASAIITKVAEKVIKVVAQLPTIEPYNPGINDLDYRNCVNIDPGESAATTASKEKAYLDAVRKGQHPECKDGYHSTGILTLDSDSELLSFSRQVAVVALELDALNRTVVAQKTPDIDRLMVNQLRGEYGVTPVIQPPTFVSPAQQVLDRFEIIAPEVRNLFSDMRFANGKDPQGHQDLQLLFTGPSKSQAIVDFTSGLTLNPSEMGQLNADFSTLLTNPTAQLAPLQP